MSKLIDLTGQKFGRLTVIKRAENKNKRVMWECKCDCGNTKLIQSAALIYGYTKSCGCYQQECRIKYNTTHGKSNTRLFEIYEGIKKRCINKNCRTYNRYGGRGITVCNEWLNDFTSFYNWAINNGYSNKLTIDRIDNDKGYSPENCRWATAKQQANNTKNTIFLTFNNERLSISEWAEKINITRSTIVHRMQRGWDIERILTTKMRIVKKK